MHQLAIQRTKVCSLGLCDDDLRHAKGKLTTQRGLLYGHEVMNH